jgi:hypothetical protein
LLPLQSNILALIFTYGAALGHSFSRGELRPASHANMGRQRLLRQEASSIIYPADAIPDGDARDTA